MATTSEVKTGLDAIAAVIAEQRAVVEKVKVNAQSASDALAAIPTNFQDIADTIDGYTPTGSFETLAKDEKSRLIAEFQALKAVADDIVAA